MKGNSKQPYLWHDSDGVSEMCQWLWTHRKAEWTRSKTRHAHESNQDEPGKELDPVLWDLDSFMKKKNRLCFAFAALRLLYFGTAQAPSRRHTCSDLLAPVSPHCVWFALVLLLTFVNRVNWLCMSESYGFSDLWMKGLLYISVPVSPSVSIYRSASLLLFDLLYRMGCHRRVLLSCVFR